MQKIRKVLDSIGNRNLLIIGLFASIILGAIGVKLDWNPSILGLLVVAAAWCFIVLLYEQRNDNKQAAQDINGAWQTMVTTIKAVHVLNMSKMTTCPDQAYKEQIIDLLMEAASHMGSNPAWRNVHRITTAGDIVRWYEAGTAKANEARPLIEAYVAKHPYAGGLGDVHH